MKWSNWDAVCLLCLANCVNTRSRIFCHVVVKLFEGYSSYDCKCTVGEEWHALLPTYQHCNKPELFDMTSDWEIKLRRTELGLAVTKLTFISSKIPSVTTWYCKPDFRTERVVLRHNTNVQRKRLKWLLSLRNLRDLANVLCNQQRRLVCASGADKTRGV